MRRVVRNRKSAWLGFVLLVTGQCLMLAHAAECGLDPHEHEGAECTLITSDDKIDNTPDALPLAAAPTIDGFFQPPRQFTRRAASWTSPPKTGPPAS